MRKNIKLISEFYMFLGGCILVFLPIEIYYKGDFILNENIYLGDFIVLFIILFSSLYSFFISFVFNMFYKYEKTIKIGHINFVNNILFFMKKYLTISKVSFFISVINLVLLILFINLKYFLIDSSLIALFSITLSFIFFNTFPMSIILSIIGFLENKKNLFSIISLLSSLLFIFMINKFFLVSTPSSVG